MRHGQRAQKSLAETIFLSLNVFCMQGHRKTRHTGKRKEKGQKKCSRYVCVGIFCLFMSSACKDIVKHVILASERKEANKCIRDISVWVFFLNRKRRHISKQADMVNDIYIFVCKYKKCIRDTSVWVLDSFVYDCVYIYIYICVYIFMYYIHIYIHMYIYIDIYVYLHMYLYISNLYISMYLYVYICLYLYTFIHICRPRSFLGAGFRPHIPPFCEICTISSELRCISQLYPFE